jgi:hypothetical protein
MMKKILLLLLVVFSIGVFAESKTKKKLGPGKPKVEVSKTPTAPCDSKEDILKKLEEKKKAEAEIGKAFSLQGGNTGCSVK